MESEEWPQGRSESRAARARAKGVLVSDAYGNGNESTNGEIPSAYGVESPRHSNASAPATSNGRTHSNASTIATETKMRQNMCLAKSSPGIVKITIRRD